MLGDLSEGEQRDVIVRVSVGAHRPGSMVELLDAVLSFDGSAAGAPVRSEEKAHREAGRRGGERILVLSRLPASPPPCESLSSPLLS